MKKIVFATIFIGTHIGFFFLQIQNQIEGIRLSFCKQKSENALAELEQKKQALVNELQTLQNKQKIKQFAQQTLQLQPIKLAKIKHLYDDE